MSDLDSIDWASLEDAYGSATEVPVLLRRADAAGSDFADEWNDLWSHLCHQGTVYTASYAALPILTSMCLRREPRGYLAPLQLAAAILASNDAPEDAEQLRDTYAAESAQLRAVAQRCVALAVSDTSTWPLAPPVHVSGSWPLVAPAKGHVTDTCTRHDHAIAGFVAGDPLWKVHQAVFAVLALESEPVDPRL